MNPQVTTTTTVPSAGGQENALIKQLMQLMAQSQGQLGDLSALARGETGLPTGADTELVAKSIEKARQIAQREAESASGQLQSQLREKLAQGGMSGGSGEYVQQNLLANQLQDYILNSLAGAQQQGAQALMNLPFQRAQLELGANQQLFNQITGTAAPVLQDLLSSRLAQTTTSENQPFDWVGLLSSMGNNATKLAGAGA